MGALGGMLGTAGGAGGTGFKGPGNAGIQQGTTLGNVATAQGGAQNALGSQNALLAALQGQNGLGQQASMGVQQQALENQLVSANGAQNSVNAINNQDRLNAQLAGANGVGTQNQAIQGLQGIAGQQQGTANQYQNIANGTGPNPAQAMLNQATGQNVANQAALMAGQRGAGANVGLMARQAGQEGGALQQQAAGQGAVMQANQQLNALSGLTAQQQAQAATQQAIGGMGTTQAGMQQAGIGQQGALAAQQIAAQQAQQQAMANQANTVAGQQIGATQAAAQGALTNQAQMQGALQGVNQNILGNQQSVNSANAGLAQAGMGNQGKLIGGVLGGAGTAAAAAMAEGGEVEKKMADGGMPAPITSTPAPNAAPAPIGAAASQPQGPSSSFGQFLKGWSDNGSGTAATTKPGEAPKSNSQDELEKGGFQAGAAIGKGIAGLFGQPGASGGTNTAGPDAKSMPKDTAMAAKGGLASKGGNVKADSAKQKASKKGDSYSNDKINAKLSEHEIVLPRSVTLSDDPVNNAARFVEQVLAKRRSK